MRQLGFNMAHVVLVAPGEIFFTRDRATIFETYLGSCVGLIFFDEAVVVAGLVHILLPDSTPEKLKAAPSRYASTAIPMLIKEMESIGGNRARFKAWMAGGADMLPDDTGKIKLDIGRRNIAAVTGLLDSYQIPLVASSVGGHFGKKLLFHMGTGTAEMTSIKNVVSEYNPREKLKPTEAGLVESIKDLSPVAGIAGRLFEMIHDEDVDFGKLKDEIYKDHALTANILKMCNSAYFGMPRQINNLSQAIVLLGSKALKKIVLTALIKPIYETGPNNYFLRRRDLFRHALGCALSADLLARKVGFPDPELAFVAGLIHDIGKVILGQYAPGEFNRLIDVVTSGKKTFEEAEQGVFGYSHAQVGGLVAENWKLPTVLIESIAFHHRPIRANTGQRVASLVHVADTVCNILGLGCGRAGFVNPIASEIMSIVPFSAEQIEDTITHLPDLLKKVEEVY